MAEVVVYDATGVVPTAMSSLAFTGDAQWSFGWGNGRSAGCQDAQWSMDLGPSWTSALFTPGRRVEVYDGPACVWGGEMSEPERGEPWTLHARGFASRAYDFAALDADGAPSSIPEAVVNEAIARGLPWLLTDGALLPDTAFSATDTTQALNTVGALLDAYAASVGKRWAVWEDGVLTLTADPETPTYFLRGGSPQMSVADDEFVTRILARYVSAAGDPPVYDVEVAEDLDASARWGVRESSLDLTKLGLMSAARAGDLAQAALTAATARTAFTSRIEVGRETLFDTSGNPARLEQVRAGVVVRLQNALDPSGNWGGMDADVVVSEVTVADGAESLSLAPLGMVARSLSDVLATPEPPEVGADLAGFAEVA